MTEKISALLLLVFGAAMAATSLLLPPEGEIDGTVLMLFAQILVYSGSIFGVKIYIHDLLLKAREQKNATNATNATSISETQRTEAVSA